MDEKKLLKEKIKRTKKEILGIGDFRPGSLTLQKGARGDKFYQISYTYQGKGRSEFVRPSNVKIVRKQLANYKNFKNLVDTLIELSFKKSRLEIIKRNKVEDNDSGM